MPRGGQGAKPTHLKIIEGTFRPDRAPKKEVVPNPVRSTDPPRGLDVYGRRYWREYAPALLRLGLLTELDLSTFRAVCEAWARYERSLVRLRAKLRNRSASDEEIRRREVSVERAEHSLRQLWDAFGMSPSSRSRLDVYAAPPEQEEDAFRRRYLTRGLQGDGA